MDYEEAVATAPPGWLHFSFDDIGRLPEWVRAHAMAGIPSGEPRDRLLRALFWTLVYHLEPEKWDELARFEPINPAVVDALPHNLDTALDVGAGSGRLTGHLVARCRHVTAIEPSTGLLALLSRRMPQVQPVAGWAEALPVKDHWSQLTTSCAAFGPDPVVLSELRRVTAPGGLIALINPESPGWFEAHGWRRMTAPAMHAPDHPRWIDEFFGPLDPPRELLTITVDG